MSRTLQSIKFPTCTFEFIFIEYILLRIFKSFYSVFVPSNATHGVCYTQINLLPPLRLMDVKLRQRPSVHIKTSYFATFATQNAYQLRILNCTLSRSQLRPKIFAPELFNAYTYKSFYIYYIVTF
jgi:hypothetical protein